MEFVDIDKNIEEVLKCSYLPEETVEGLIAKVWRFMYDIRLKKFSPRKIILSVLKVP